jgi:hypothetical protein
MTTKPIRIVDSLAQALLFVGTTHFITEGLRSDKRKPSNQLSTMYFGLLGAAAIYSIGRKIGPKTPEEKRAAQLTNIYNQAASYRRRAELYRRGAEMLVKRGLHGIKTVTATK